MLVFAGKNSLRLLSASEDGEQFDLEDQSRTRRNGVARSAVAIRQIRGDDELVLYLIKTFLYLQYLVIIKSKLKKIICQLY